jgi:hypothetical protein
MWKVQVLILPVFQCISVLIVRVESDFHLQQSSTRPPDISHEELTALTEKVKTIKALLEHYSPCS